MSSIGCVPLSPQERQAEQARRAHAQGEDWLQQSEAEGDEEGLLSNIMKDAG